MIWVTSTFNILPCTCKLLFCQFTCTEPYLAQLGHRDFWLLITILLSAVAPPLFTIVKRPRANSGSTSLIAAPLLSVKSIVCLAMFVLLYKWYSFFIFLYSFTHRHLEKSCYSHVYSLQSIRQIENGAFSFSPHTTILKTLKKYHT